MGFLIGLLAGFFGGLVGLSGGAIMIPLLVRCFKFSQRQAHGTSLMVLAFTGLSGAFTYYLNGSVDLVAAALLAAAAILTTRYGALYAHSLPEWQLTKAFGFFLVCASLLLLSKPYFSYLTFLPHPTGLVKVAILLACGAAIGFLSGMMGSGGGAFMVVAMVLVVGLNQYTAQGSSLLAMVPAGAMGAYTHWRLGNVVIRVLSALILGIVIGTYSGGSLAHLLSEANLRLVSAAVLIWLGLRDIRGAAKKRALLEVESV